MERPSQAGRSEIGANLARWQGIRELPADTLSTKNRLYLMTNRSARPNTAADALTDILTAHLGALEGALEHG